MILGAYYSPAHAPEASSSAPSSEPSVYHDDGHGATAPHDHGGDASGGVRPVGWHEVAGIWRL